jgi:NADPH2:quinone reductase
LIVIEVGAHGGAEALRVVERSLPPVRADEVLVHNRWIGVNWVDLQHVAGTPYPTAVPFVPGTEAAGEVMAVGSRVRDLAAGAPVVHFGHMGGVYAEYTAVPAGHVVPLDDPGLVRDAAALAINGTTAHVLLRDAAGVRPGQVVVVQAAAGGTGGALVQLAVAAGAEVVAMASGAAKADAATELGAHHAIALDEVPDALAALLATTGGRRADVVFDGNGQDTFDTSIELLATFGTLVLYGQSSGPVSPVDPAVLSGLQGSSRRKGSLALRWANAGGDYLADPAARRSAMRQVLGAVSGGRLASRVAAEFPLVRAADAHRALAGRRVNGKILLEVPRNA